MQRTIKSFVLRAGRMSRRQTFALTNWLGDYKLPYPAELWDLSTLFKNQAPTIVEIGFGMGASLITMAKENPDKNFIGIEVHQAGIGSLVAEAHDEKLENLRVIDQDAVRVFKEQIPLNSLAGIQIFFPDPWHKKKHHKRRLIQPAFVNLLTLALKPGGFIHCATDWEEYALFMLDVLTEEKNLINSQPTKGFAPRPETRPLTKFELRGKRLGHQVWDLIFYKQDTPAAYPLA